jgi:anti-sigma-K factor RskA
MTVDDRRPERSDCGHDAAAYVLGALESEEATAFRRHMVGCVVCRDEVAALQGVADALPMAAPRTGAPPSIKRRLMTEVRADAKRRRRAPDRRWTRARPVWPALGRPAMAAGALLAAFALALGAFELGSGSSPPQLVRATVVGGTGNAVLRLSGGHAELAMEHIPAPPPGRIYEVWVKRGTQPPSPTSALFDVTRSGAGAVDVPGNLHGVSEVLVTPEPLGGSLVPTRAPVIVAQISRQ